MRILLVTSMVPDEDGLGAIPKLLAAQLEGLTAHNEVTLVAGFGEDRGQAEAAARLFRSDLDAHFVDRRRSPHAGRRWRVRAELAATWVKSDWPWRVVSGAGGVQPLLDCVAAGRQFDIVAVEDNPVAMLRFPTNVPTVLTEHEAVRAPIQFRRPGQPVDLPRQALRNLDWSRWHGFLPSAWNRFDLVQVYCDADARAIAERAPELASRVRINPFGTHLPALPDLSRELPETILFTGTFAHPPNREAATWLARAIMPVVWRARPHARLRIVGSNPPAEIRGLSSELVDVVADAPSIAPHLAEAAVIAAPVRSGGGMRMKVLEAMALGKAVVTTPLGAEGFTSLAAEPPLVIADEPAALGAAIGELLKDCEGRNRLGHEARAFAERWHSPTAWAQRLVRVYSEAANMPRDTRMEVP